MAIQIGSVPVITDSRALVNITGASSDYAFFGPNPVIISSGINLSNTLMLSTLSSNTSFSAFNFSQGRHSTIVMDRGSRTPTFPSSIKWSGGVQPVWSSNRYWVITIICLTSSVAFASAAGYNF